MLQAEAELEGRLQVDFPEIQPVNFLKFQLGRIHMEVDMQSCSGPGDFKKYFDENMAALGLPIPVTLFGSIQVAVETATLILAQIDRFGELVTLRELVTAGTQFERLVVIGGCSAAYFAGAVIGSIAVAIGEMFGCGTSLADVIFVASKHNINRPWLVAMFQQHPEMYGKHSTVRESRRHLGVVT